MPSDDIDELDAIIVELYAVSPGEFTAARTARAKNADRTLATMIGAIRKPVVAAWVVDLLAREGHLTDALALGAALREAQDDLDAQELARLGRQRRQLVAALAKTGADLAAAQGVPVSAAAQQDVEATINAALIEEAAASAVLTARLAKPLDAAGDIDPGDAVSGSLPSASAAAPSTVPDDELAERRARREAEKAARDAERDAERASHERGRVEAERDRAQERADQLNERAEGLRRELERAERAAADAASELDELSRAVAAAAATARSAAQRARAARSAVEDDG